MYDMQFVEIVDASEQLSEYDSDHILVEVLPFLDEVDDGPALAELSNHLVPFLRFKHLEQLYYVGVVHLLQQLEFGEDLSLFSLAQNFLLYYLYRSFLLCLEADCPVNASKGALSDDFLKFIVFLDVFVA